MAIPSRQIGWGTEENLLWQISKQIDYLTKVAYNASNIQVPSNNIVIANLPNDQTIVPNGDTLVNFTSITDPNGWFINDGSLFQPTIAGYYNISCSVLWQTAIGGNQLNTQINKNGTIQVYINQSQLNINDNYSQSGSVIVYLNGTTDYIIVTVFTSNDVDQIIQGGNGTLFNASLI